MEDFDYKPQINRTEVEYGATTTTTTHPPVFDKLYSENRDRKAKLKKLADQFKCDFRPRTVLSPQRQRIYQNQKKESKDAISVYEKLYKDKDEQLKRKNEISNTVNQTFLDWKEKNRFKPNLERFANSPKIKDRMNKKNS